MTFLAYHRVGGKPERGWVRFHQGPLGLTSPVKVIRILEAQLRFVHPQDTTTEVTPQHLLLEKAQETHWAGLGFGRKAKRS